GRSREKSVRRRIDEDGLLDRRRVDLRAFVERARCGRDIDTDIDGAAEEGLQARFVHEEEDDGRFLRPDLEAVAALGRGDEGGGAPEPGRLVADEGDAVARLAADDKARLHFMQ